MPKITALLVAAATFLAGLCALFGSIHSVATDPSFYVDDSREAVAASLGEGNAPDDAVTAYIGLSRAEQTEFAEEIAAQMRAKAADFALPILNEREQQHLLDVHRLIALCNQAAHIGLGIAGLLAVAAAWTGANIKKRHVPAAVGALCGIGIWAILTLALGLIWHFSGFTDLFSALHRALFDNDLWLLNPDTSILIRMMPQSLFEHAVVQVLLKSIGTFAVILAVLIAFYALIGGMIHRNLTEKEQI